MTGKPTVPGGVRKIQSTAFRTVEFDKMIEARGMQVLWYRALACPCRNMQTRTADPSCSLCGGSSWHYVNPKWSEAPHEDPFAPAKLTAVLGQIGLEVDETQAPGLWMSSDSLLTVRGPVRVGFRDRFVALGQEMGWTEQVIRVAGTAPVPVGLQGRPAAAWDTAMRYAPIRVNHVIGADGTRYRERIDFLLTPSLLAGSQLSWIDGRGPAAGTVFAVHYICRPVWVVDQAVFWIQHSRGPTDSKSSVGQQDLPTTFKVRLDFLARAME